MTSPSDTNDSNPLKVRRGRVASVDLYEIKDSELDLLDKGSPATAQLNFAVFLLSLAFTSIAALCTATFKWHVVQTIFLIVAIVGILMGAYLLIRWWKTRTSNTRIVRAIRDRMEAPEARASVVPPTPAPDSQPSAETDPAG